MHYARKQNTQQNLKYITEDVSREDDDEAKSSEGDYQVTNKTPLVEEEAS
jgi:hypothetical protein